MNYDTHAGNLQQSNGNILSVNRSAVYLGAGSMAVAAGTVNIPGVFLGGNTALGSSATWRADSSCASGSLIISRSATRFFFRWLLAYSELLRAEGRHAVALQAREEARAIATADG